MMIARIFFHNRGKGFDIAGKDQSFDTTAELTVKATVSIIPIHDSEKGPKLRYLFTMKIQPLRLIFHGNSCKLFLC
jgi:hypothetical protein